MEGEIGRHDLHVEIGRNKMTDATDDEEGGEGPLANELADLPTICRQLASLRSDSITLVSAAVGTILAGRNATHPQHTEPLVRPQQITGDRRKLQGRLRCRW